MPFATNRGCRIAYDVVGSGPAVVLQGGLTSRRIDVARLGYVDVFADAYQVINVDSLGHGDSDKPSDCTLYGGAQRAGDIVAVLDEIGVDRAHMLGYSMGGWLACAVVMHHPTRLAAVIVGGWDPLGESSGSAMGLEDLLAMGRAQVPEQMEWITPDVEPALRCCSEALDEIDGIEAALARFERPILLWDGDDDASGDAARRLASRHEHVQFLETAGDHMAAWFNDECGVARTALRAFVDRARETELPAST